MRLAGAMIILVNYSFSDFNGKLGLPEGVSHEYASVIYVPGIQL